MPGSEVLGREVFAAGGTYIVVDVFRSYMLHISFVIHELEKPLPRKFMTLLHDTYNAPVGEIGVLHDSAFSLELKCEMISADSGAPIFQRSQAVRTAFSCVYVVADTHAGLIQ